MLNFLSVLYSSLADKIFSVDPLTLREDGRINVGNLTHL